MVLDDRKRWLMALENLQARDLENMAVHSLQLMIEQQARGPNLPALLRDILGGLPNCSKPAARSRLLLAQQALDQHGRKLPVAFMPELVQLLLAYIQTQHTSVLTDELARLCSLIMETLLPPTAEAMQRPAVASHTHTHAHARALHQLPRPRRGSLPAGAVADGVDGCEKCSGGGGGAGGGGLASAGGLVAAVLRPVLKLACKGTECSTMSAACIMLEHLLAPCASFLHVKDVMGAVKLCLNMQLTMLGPLDRHVASIFAPLQQAAELLGISIDTDMQRQAFNVCMRGAAASEDWHMRSAAVQALGRMALAVQVPDPLLACCEEEGLREYPKSHPHPLVITPAVVQMCRLKPEATQVLSTARHDRVGSVRQAAQAALEALAGLPPCDTDDQDCEDCAQPRDQDTAPLRERVDFGGGLGFARGHSSGRMKKPDVGGGTSGVGAPLCGAELAVPLPPASACVPSTAQEAKQRQQAARKRAQRQLLQDAQEQEEDAQHAAAESAVQRERQRERQFREAEQRQRRLMLELQQARLQEEAAQSAAAESAALRESTALRERQHNEDEQRQQLLQLQQARLQARQQERHARLAQHAQAVQFEEQQRTRHEAQQRTRQEQGQTRQEEDACAAFQRELEERTEQQRRQQQQQEQAFAVFQRELEEQTKQQLLLQQQGGQQQQEREWRRQAAEAQALLDAYHKHAAILQGGGPSHAHVHTHGAPRVSGGGGGQQQEGEGLGAASVGMGTVGGAGFTAPSSATAAPSLTSGQGDSHSRGGEGAAALLREDTALGGATTFGGECAMSATLSEALQKYGSTSAARARHLSEATAAADPSHTASGRHTHSAHDDLRHKYPQPLQQPPHCSSTLQEPTLAHVSAAAPPTSHPTLPVSDDTDLQHPHLSSMCVPAPAPKNPPSLPTHPPYTRDPSPSTARSSSPYTRDPSRLSVRAPSPRMPHSSSCHATRDPSPYTRDPSRFAVRAPSPRVRQSASPAARDPSPLSPRDAARMTELARRPRWNAHQVKHNPQAAQQAWQMELAGLGGGRHAWTAGLDDTQPQSGSRAQAQGQHVTQAPYRRPPRHSTRSTAAAPPWLPNQQQYELDTDEAARPALHARAPPVAADAASEYAARRSALQQQQRAHQQAVRQQQRLQQRQCGDVHAHAGAARQRARQRAHEQQRGRAVLPCWRGSGGGGGAAAAYASMRERHPFLVADRTRISLHWAHAPRYGHIGPTFHRPAVHEGEDFDFGVQVFVKPEPVYEYIGQPTNISLPPVLEVGEESEGVAHSRHTRQPDGSHCHSTSDLNPSSLHAQQQASRQAAAEERPDHAHADRSLDAASLPSQQQLVAASAHTASPSASPSSSPHQHQCHVGHIHTSPSIHPALPQHTTPHSPQHPHTYAHSPHSPTAPNTHAPPVDSPTRHSPATQPLPLHTRSPHNESLRPGSQYDEQSHHPQHHHDTHHHSHSPQSDQHHTQQPWHQHKPPHDFHPTQQHPREPYITLPPPTPPPPLTHPLPHQKHQLYSHLPSHTPHPPHS